MMKKLVSIILAAAAIMAVSCDPETPVLEVVVQLSLDDSPLNQAGIVVNITDGGSFTADYETSSDGQVQTILPVGVYTASTSFKKSEEGKLLNFNGSVTITLVKDGDLAFNLPLTSSVSSQLIIKEIYNGGCMDNEGAKNYQMDKYIIIYNNSDVEADASKLCIAMAQISSNVSMNKYIGADGETTYFKEGWVPASYSIWWFQDGTQVIIPPFSQIVVAVNGAVDHTQTYSKSVDLSKADYCMYDRESGFNNANYYPAPSASIPESHYMKTFVYGTGNAWPLPMQMAAPFIIMPDNDIKAFVQDPSNFDNKASNLSGNFAKVPQSWVLDAMDLWPAADETKNFARFPANINTGYEVFTSKMGYSVYRNVDKEATEAIEGNAGKLVYSYAGAVDAEDTDPSGIDAEASIANGARIIYMDTNNCGNDFHVRKVASIKK